MLESEIEQRTLSQTLSLQREWGNSHKGLCSSSLDRCTVAVEAAAAAAAQNCLPVLDVLSKPLVATSEQEQSDVEQQPVSAVFALPCTPATPSAQHQLHALAAQSMRERRL
jgi:hypothetical protein